MNAQSKIEAANLASAYVAAFAEIEGAAKDANNPHFKSKYADLPSIIAAIKPALSKHGLAFVQKCEPSADGVTVETVLLHQSGETMSLGALFVPANKKDAQGFGSAQTYARRYSLQTAFGVPAEDDDGNAASRPAQQQQAPVSGISDADLAQIQQLCQAVGGDQPSRICSAYKIEALPELTDKQAKVVIANLNDKLAAKAKAESDARAREDA